MVYLNWQEHDRAEQAFRKSLDLDPSYHPANYGVGIVYFHRALQSANDGNNQTVLSHFQQSRDWITKALASNPRYIKAHMLQATVLTFLEEYGLAMNHLNEVIRLEPGTSVAREAESKLKIIAPWAAAAQSGG